MSQECLMSGCQRKFSMENCKCSKGGQKKRYKDTLKASLKDFNIPTESWEQAAQYRTKLRCLINKCASQCEAKRICEAERKRNERKARAKELSSDSAQSEFTCSICNRQFRAKMGLCTHGCQRQFSIENCKCSQGCQKKRYKDTLKASLKDFNIPTESWEQAAQDRTEMRCLINKGASQFEAKIIC